SSSTPTRPGRPRRRSSPRAATPLSPGAASRAAFCTPSSADARSRMLYEALKPLLFSLDAERAHEEVSGLMSLLAPLPGAAAVLSALTGRGAAGLEKTVFGVRFPNPLGLAAGFDKDGKLV